MLANVVLPGLMCCTPMAFIVVICETAVYWLVQRRTHPLRKLLTVVIIVNAVSTTFGWLVVPSLSTMPSPTGYVAVASQELTEERGTVVWAITERFALGLAASVVIEGAVLFAMGPRLGVKP